ncbi:MAG: hypothetical protein JW818_11375 [Pirellulales bacterium]|nr:hypothetical protein [Pirellulales bacterium]
MTWTKASRGGDGARIRNALPDALPLPLEAFTAPWTLHSIYYHESNDFTKEEVIKKTDSPDVLGIRVLRFKLCNRQLAVSFLHDSANAALVDRIQVDLQGNEILEVDAFVLEPEQWGQLVYNGRFVDMDTGNWWYEHTVFNIGLGLKPAKDLFRSTRPASRFVELARLH